MKSYGLFLVRALAPPNSARPSALDLDDGRGGLTRVATVSPSRLVGDAKSRKPSLNDPAGPARSVNPSREPHRELSRADCGSIDGGWGSVRARFASWLREEPNDSKGMSRICSQHAAGPGIWFQLLGTLVKKPTCAIAARLG